MLAPVPQLGDIQVAGLHWERIQLVLRLRLRPGARESLHDAELFLRPSAEDREPLAARPKRVDDPIGAERWVRFNVFAGPGQMPLDPDAWTVTARYHGEAAGCTVSVAADFEAPLTATRDFVFGREMYRINVRPAREGQPLTLGTSAWAKSTRNRQSRPFHAVRSWWRRTRRGTWLRLFEWLISALGHLPRRARLIVFTSDSRVGLGGNLKLVHDRMVERGLDRDYQLRTIFKASIRARRTTADRLRLVWLLARADVILIDDYQPAIYRLKRRAARIIQLWHAWGAFKTVGYSRIGKPGGPSPYSLVHKNYSYATVSSTFEVPFYAEAFGLSDERVVPTGTPRMDEFLDPAHQHAGREAALGAVPGARNRQVILFAPTFRGRGARQAHYAMHLIDFGALHALCRERDAVVIFKMHPFVRSALEIPAEYADRLVDVSGRSIEVNDLLLITDLLVTDYSSLVFEYSTLGGPMLFFAYDLERYVATRDFYEPYEAFVPGRIVRTFDELLDAIRRDDFEAHKVAPFAARHRPEGGGTATDRIIDELIVPP